MFLPDTPLPKKLYTEQVYRPLLNLGGEWVKPVQAWRFPFNPTERLAEFRAGVFTKLDSKYHYFSTPAWLSHNLFQFAQECGIRPWELHDVRTAKVGDPSAGRGDLLKRLRLEGYTNLYYYELMPENRQILEREVKRLGMNATYLGDDFEKGTETGFDLLLANPPFRHEKRHIDRMLDVLVPGGLLLCITSPKLYDDRAFQDRLDGRCLLWEMRLLESDKDDPIFEGTNIGCVMLVARKSCKQAAPATPPSAKQAGQLSLV